MNVEKLYKRINNFFSDKKVQYQGKISQWDDESTNEFKFKIIGTKTLLRVGEPIDYVVVEVYDMTSSSIAFKVLANNIDLTTIYYLQSGLEKTLENILSVFNIYDVVVVKIEPSKNVK